LCLSVKAIYKGCQIKDILFYFPLAYSFAKFIFGFVYGYFRFIHNLYVFCVVLGNKLTKITLSGIYE
ncbi:MAG: hypothetical protein JWQ09_1286, partial [Segetibacter sp.]|nr:hypothetical protein [Segetibacter sp.]